jgi:hypothetical protein
MFRGSILLMTGYTIREAIVVEVSISPTIRIVAIRTLPRIMIGWSVARVA